MRSPVQGNHKVSVYIASSAPLLHDDGSVTNAYSCESHNVAPTEPTLLSTVVSCNMGLDSSRNSLGGMWSCKQSCPLEAISWVSTARLLFGRIPL